MPLADALLATMARSLAHTRPWSEFLLLHLAGHDVLALPHPSGAPYPNPLSMFTNLENDSNLVSKQAPRASHSPPPHHHHSNQPAGQPEGLKGIIHSYPTLLPTRSSYILFMAPSSRHRGAPSTRAPKSGSTQVRW
jgi:hypothetical protein